MTNVVNNEESKELYLEELTSKISEFDFLKPHEKKRVIEKLKEEIDNIYTKPRSFCFTFKNKIYSAQRPRLGKRGFYAPDSANKKHITKMVEEQIEEYYKNCNFSSYNEIEVVITANFKKLAKLTKYEQVLYKLGLKFMVKKPDVDNIAKIYLDACNKILWEDDAHITKLTVEKKYADEEILKMEVKYK